MSPARPDPGAARPDWSRAHERTRLSWRRTMLAAGVVALLTVRLAMQERLPAVAALTGLTWVGVLAVGWRRARGLAPTPPPTAGRAPLAVALAVVGYAVLGAVLAVVHVG